MDIDFSRRSSELELMDTERIPPSDMSGILAALERINRLLGGARATLWHLERFARGWKTGETVRIVDWGAGGADIPRAIVRWARARRRSVKIWAVDDNDTVVQEARRRCASYPEIVVERGSALTFDPPEPVDYAISSLTLHHLSDADIVALLKRSDRLSRRGLIMNDLIRSRRAWLWIHALARAARLHPIVRNDGPLSVRRAFRHDELLRYGREAGLSYLNVQTFFGYRQTLAGEKS
jgi:hypothetical protein